MKRILSLFLLFTLFSSSLLALNPYSNSELDSLEKEFVEQINQSNQVIHTPLAVSYLNQIGKRLSEQALNPPPVFFIVNSDEINAFAGPGGYIGINTALILATDTEDELAAVMAHELAHVKLHHLYDMIEHQRLMKVPTLASLLAAAALGIINPTLGSGAIMATLSGAAQHTINYTRIHEKEADRIGMQLLTQAHFHPQAMAQFFKKLQEHTRYYDRSNVPAILQTHPLDEERIAEAENRTANLTLPNTPQPIDYLLFKALIRNLTAASPKTLFDYYAKAPPTLANQYGFVLALISTNRFEAANIKLTSLFEKAPDNPFFVFAKAQIELGLHHENEAVEQLTTFYQSHPNDYPALFALGETLLEVNRPHQATLLLTKGFRRYPHTLSLCKLLAKAEAANKRPAYAYFIESNCESLQGHTKQALQRLKTAKSLVKNDSYLQARIEATLEEIRALKSE